MELRKNAYIEVYNISGDVSFRDRKGVWTLGHLIRNKIDSYAHTQYTLYVYFHADLKCLPKADPGPISSFIYVNDNTTPEQLKGRIRGALGYTPEKRTVEDMFSQFTRLRLAYEEEDRYYSSQNKDEAKAILDNILAAAFRRIELQQITPFSKYSSNRRLPYEKYLLKDEIAAAVEAQKVLNGHSFEEPLSIIQRTGHLADLNQKIDEKEEEVRRHIKQETDRALTAQLLELLDTDVELRKLVSLVLECYREIRTGDYKIEVGHRLFGYTSDLDEYRDKVCAPLKELLSRYRLPEYDMFKLLSIGDLYIQDGGILPPHNAPFERLPGCFYYGDRVCYGDSTYKVQSVGRIYVYLEKIGKTLKSKVRHLERANYIVDPVTVEDFIFNELARLNNNGLVPEAHLKTIHEAVHILNSFSSKARSMRSAYYSKLHQAENENAKKAFQCFLDGLLSDSIWIVRQPEKDNIGIKTS